MFPVLLESLGERRMDAFESGKRRRRNRLADYSSLHSLGFFAWSSPFRTAWFGGGALRMVSEPGSSERDFSYSLMIEFHSRAQLWRPKPRYSSEQRRVTEQTGLHIHTAGTRNRCLLGDGPARRPQSWVESKKLQSVLDPSRLGHRRLLVSGVTIFRILSGSFL
jgi:hypothetical protein